MKRCTIPVLICCVAALPAGEAKGRHDGIVDGKVRHHVEAAGKGHHHAELGTVLGRQAIDAGHVIEVRSVPGQPGEVLIRWGDIDNVIAKGSGKGQGFAWTGSATGTGVSLVSTVAFEDGSRAKKPEAKAGRRAGDHLVGSPADSVSWETRTYGAWDGVLLHATSGSTLAITADSTTISVKIP